MMFHGKNITSILVQLVSLVPLVLMFIILLIPSHTQAASEWVYKHGGHIICESNARSEPFPGCNPSAPNTPATISCTGKEGQYLECGTREGELTGYCMTNFGYTAQFAYTPDVYRCEAQAVVNEPIGSVDEYSCSNGVSGWACDKDGPWAPINVHVYEGGSFLDNISAAATREAAVGLACGGGTNHGFTFPIPNSLKTGTSRTLTFYGINIGPTGSVNRSIGSMSVNCPAPVSGSCGTSHNSSFTSPPSTNLCSTGALSWTDNTGTDGSYNWSCNGSNGGTNASCSASRTVPTYIYTFNSNGGAQTYTSVTGVAGSSVSSPGSPTRAGYTFTGWSPALPTTMPVNGGGSTAQWSANACALPPSWGGGSVASGGSVTAYLFSSVTSPSACTSQTRTCEAGTLSGSYTNQSCAVTNTTVNGSCSATAETCTAGTPSNSPADTATHYRWTCLGGGSPAGADSGTCSVAIPTYTYTFSSNGGTPSTYTSVTGVAGSSVSSPGSPTRAGYTFTGWSPAIPSTMPVNGGGSTAQWSANPTASISANNCTILENASTCNSAVSWSSSYVSSPQVRQDGSVFSSLTSGSASRSVSNGNTTFRFYDGGSELASSVAVGSCESGTSWNGSSCVNSAPATPTGLTVTANPSCGVGEVSLSWNASSNATGYTITRDGSVLDITSGTTYLDTGRALGTTYSYRVRAYNAGGDSAYTSSVSVTTASSCPTGNISADALTVVYNGTRTISWTSSNTSSCIVSRTDGGTDWIGTSSLGETTAPLIEDETYVLICDGIHMDAVTISVLAIPTLSVDTRIVRPNTVVNLEYNTNAQSCTLTGGALPSTPLSGNSVYPVTVRAKTTYTLTCPGGTVQATVEIIPRTFET